MSFLLISGFTTTINGPSEQTFVLPLDGDGKGIEEPAHLSAAQLMMKKGMNTYVGPLAGTLPASSCTDFFHKEREAILKALGAENSDSAAAALVPPLPKSDHLPFNVGSRWVGNFFHDEYGGITGDIPRGSFWFRAQRLDERFSHAAASGELDFISFYGSTTSSLAGMARPLQLLTVFSKAPLKQPVSHPGKFVKEHNDLVLQEITREAGGRILLTTYTGKWASTPQNEKFCGSFVTHTVSQLSSGGVPKMESVDSGSFFTQAEYVKFD